MLTAIALSQFALADDVHKLKVSGRIQGRYEYEMLKDVEDSAESAFTVPRARLKASGHAFSENYTYGLQIDFGKGQVSLKDAKISLAADNGVQLTMGQFKKPFARQQLTSSGSQAFVDRLITDKAFGNGRDVGMQLHNGMGKATGFTWAAGIFNGSGDKGLYEGDVVVDLTTGEGEIVSAKQTNVPDNVAPLVVARAEWSTDGKHYKDVDFAGDDLRFAVGANTQASMAEDAGFTKHGVDASVKVSGVHVTGGFYYATSQTGEAFGDQEGSLMGYYGKGSYVIADQFAPALGAAMVDDVTGTEQDVEMMVGFGWFPHKHKLKWQTDVAQVANYGIPGTDEEALRIRTQVQMIF